jgi:plasmid stabilization system protein ParE
MIVEWSDDALADLERFAEFLEQHYPALAQIVAREIIAETKILSRHPKLGKPIAGHGEFRQVVLEVLKAPYIFQYRFDGERLVMLRLFHGREERE